MRFMNHSFLGKKADRETFFPAIIAMKKIRMFCIACVELLVFFSVSWWAFYKIGWLSLKQIYAIAIPVTCLFLLSMPFISREKVTLQRAKAVRKVSGSEIAERIAEFYEDKFVWKQVETGNERAITYSSLRLFFESKNYFVFTVGESPDLYILAKDGFTVGTADDFRTFMQEIVDENNRKR